MSKQLSSVAALMVLGMATIARGQAADYVWWEGENTSATNFPARHTFEPADAQETAVLSGGKWLGAEGQWGKKLFAEYEVEVPAGGEWKLYARKFWKHGPFTWSMGENKGEITRDVSLLDEANIRQFLGANWVYLGDVKLPAGKNKLRIDMTGTEGAVCFDAFVLTKDALVPRGKLKPGEKWDRADPGFFPFEPDRDPYKPSPMSMRGLSEAFAGENGWIQAKGSAFVHEKTGVPVRFWAVNTGMESVRKDRASVDEQARFWAKRGVNMVRIHGGIWRDDDFTKVDGALLDQMHYYVAAMKREGIYIYLSNYFPLWLKFNDKTPGFPGYPAGGAHPFAIQFFSERFQEIQRGWFRELLTTPNPYAGGVPLVKDPAVAMIEIVNEDSYFFWTFSPYENVPGPQMEILEGQFGTWLAGKFGSVEKALAGFGGAAVRGDDAAAGRVGLIGLYNLFNSKSPRGMAQAEFLARHQNAYFVNMRKFLKTDLGYAGLVSASNWTVADQRTLMPLEKWSNALDFLDRHGYWSGPHEGEMASYSVSKGDMFDDKSALVGPVSTPLYETKWMDLPSTITEINWTPPNRFRAEFPVLSALYGTLQGNDAWFFFATANHGFDSQIGKFALHTPTVAGQWPATSLIYRKGLVKEAGTALRIDSKLADLFALKGAPVATTVNLDMNRFAGVPAAQAAADAINPLYFLVGRVESAITEGGAATTGVDLSKFVDVEKKTVRSMTGELLWDFGKGIVTVDAPQANGAVGFLAKGGEISLGTLKLSSPLEYGSVLLVSLDDKPLATSGRMLLQLMTEDKNYGFKAPGTGKRAIADLGAAPLTMREVEGTVSLTRADAAGLKVTKLDLNGYPVGAATPLGAGLKLDPRTIYYVIEK